MCGIVGFNWEDSDGIRACTTLLHHRGPEQEGFYVAGEVSLGHKRLCILDLSEKGRQPMANEDGSVIIVFNGEIFNFQELRRDLETAGHVFHSHTDTEVLVHGYEQWGTDLLDKVNGQFSFCILDVKRRQLLLARDRLGIKPLYIHSANGRFVFGSELKSLLSAGIDKTIHPQSLAYYYLFGHTPAGASILQDVQKLLPGHYLTYDLEQKEIVRCEPYWRPVFAANESLREEDVVAQFREKIQSSVRRRLIADVPLGAFLSGGVDSSIIVAAMRDHVDDLKTFSIRFDYADFNESHYARIVSEKFGTHHFEIDFNAGDVKKLIAQLPYHYDDPFGDPSMIPTCLVCQVARSEVTVSLSGTGGDELFGGYPRYREFSILRRLNHLPSLLKGILKCGTATVSGLSKSDKLNKLQSFLGPRETDATIYLKLLSYMFRGPDEPQDRLSELADMSGYFPYPDPVDNILNFDLQQYLPEDLLVKEDRASMAVSLEARVPFLDHELVEWALTIPRKLKIRAGEPKWILKKAYEGILPHEILYRKKRGFGVPLVHYLRKELKDEAYQRIFDGLTHEYFDRAFLQWCWDRHQSGRSDYSRILWSAMMFNGWYDRWMRSSL